MGAADGQPWPDKERKQCFGIAVARIDHADAALTFTAEGNVMIALDVAMEGRARPAVGRTQGLVTRAA
ncbi:hypothetical protein CLM74_03255 [Stenotrophomonas sp. MYb57]|nr:hypothetical protein CLM74_03255 [Stenotrophomonas sp. MYb57]